MRKKHYIILLALLLLVLCYFCSKCSSIVAFRIEKSKEMILDYFEQNKDILTEIAKECLRIEGSREEIYSVQVDMELGRVDVFTDGGSETLDFTVSEQLNQLLSMLHNDDTPFDKIGASDFTHFFDTRNCTFDYTLYVHGDPYFHFELTYCEDPETRVNSPELTQKLDSNWYFLSYGYE